MIKFEKVRWKNFLSTGDQWTNIQLDKTGTTLVVGANGAGKSTLLDALCFVLFNKPYRRITKLQMVNSSNEKGTLVEVDFKIGTKQSRSLVALISWGLLILRNGLLNRTKVSASSIVDFPAPLVPIIRFVLLC